MNRTSIAVATVAVLATALPSFAADHSPEYQVASGPQTVASSGGAAVSIATTAQLKTLPGEQFVTGDVVLVTPDEVVLHTAKGMQKFAVTGQTDETSTPYQGERITVGYIPERGAVQVLASRPQATNQNSTRVAEATMPPANENKAGNTWGAAKPAKAEPAPAPMPAVQPAVAKSASAHPRARLPKTASERPLILVIGLFAVAGAGTLRLALHA